MDPIQALRAIAEMKVDADTNHAELSALCIAIAGAAVPGNERAPGGPQIARPSLSLSWSEPLRIPPTYGPAVLSWLRVGNGVQVIGSVAAGVVVRRGFSGGHDVWFISDNGGELNVERANSPETLRSIPYHVHGVAVNAITLAARIADAMWGREIDWSDLHDGFGLDEGPDSVSSRAAVAR